MTYTPFDSSGKDSCHDFRIYFKPATRTTIYLYRIQPVVDAIWPLFIGTRLAYLLLFLNNKCILSTPQVAIHICLYAIICFYINTFAGI